MGRDQQVGVDALYAAFKIWAEDNGHERMSKAMFGRNLRAVSPAVHKTRLWGGGDREMAYSGIGLRSEKG
jgi:putative DNA primase/helicase